MVSLYCRPPGKLLPGFGSGSAAVAGLATAGGPGHGGVAGGHGLSTVEVRLIVCRCPRACGLPGGLALIAAGVPVCRVRCPPAGT